MLMMMSRRVFSMHASSLPQGAASPPVPGLNRAGQMSFSFHQRLGNDEGDLLGSLTVSSYGLDVV